MCVSGLRSLYFIELLDFILGCPCSVAKLPVSSTDLWSAHKVDNVVFRADQLAEGCFIAPGNASSGRIGLLLFFRKAMVVWIDCASDTRDGRSGTDCLICAVRHRVALCKIAFCGKTIKILKSKNDALIRPGLARFGGLTSSLI
jgi:hypothetical protein